MRKQVGVALIGCAAVVLFVRIAAGDGELTATKAPAGVAVGTISGSIAYSGATPEPGIVQMAADPFCVTAHAGQEVLTDQLVVNDNDTLRWAFVHIRDAGGTLPSGGADTVVLDQVACMYTPRVLGMQAGATFRVINSDQTLHNVNVQPENNTAFNVAQPIPGMATERVFENPEVMIPVRCDVHPWMQAYVGVVPHGFFAVTGEDGAFSLEDVPAGDYVIEAWHETLGTQAMNVTVRDGESTSADFSFGGDR